MLLLIAAIAAALCGLCAAVLYQERGEAYLRAEQTTAGILTTVDYDVQRNVEICDLSVRSLRSVIEQTEATRSGPVGQAIHRQFLYDKATSSEYLGALAVLDADGNVVETSLQPGSSAMNFRDRDYFQVHRDRPDAGLYISVPFHSRLRGGDFSIAISRRISHPDGSFAGVVFGTLRLAYFHDLFGATTLGTQDGVTLFRTDGTLLARRDFDDGQVGRNLSDNAGVRAMLDSYGGQTEAVSAIDGVRRLYSYTRVGGLPLMLDVSVPVADIYAAWWEKTLAIGSVTIGLCAAMGMLAFLLRRELARRVLAEQEVRANEARYRLVADNASDIILHLGPSGDRRYVSPSVREMLGFEPEELLGWSWIAMVHPDDRVRMQAELAEVRNGAGLRTSEYRCLCKDGSERWLEAHIRPVRDAAFGLPDGLLINARDVTRRKQAEDKLAQIAATDALTGLANRRRFDEMLEQEWRRALREEQPISLLLLDADSFKAYNDHYGHPRGDDLLRAIAACVAGNTRRPGDLVARHGGEEFAVLLPATEPSGAVTVAEQIRLAVMGLGAPHAGGVHGVATVSIGVACLLPTPELTSAELIRAADKALYAAKRAGRNRTEMARPDAYPPYRISGSFDG